MKKIDFSTFGLQKEYWNDARELLVGPVKFETLRKELNPVYMLLNDMKNLKILDFGCGIGRIYQTLRNRDIDLYVGYDISEKYHKIAIDRYKESNLMWILSNNDVLPFKDNYFDFIIAYSVFTHIPIEQTVEILRDFRRVIKDTGFMAFTVFYKGSAPNWVIIIERDFLQAISDLELEIVKQFVIPEGSGEQHVYVLRRKR